MADKTRTCPRCGKIYDEPPALSRVDSRPVCPMCGHREALEAAVKAGAMDREQADRIMDTIREAKRGRID